VQWPGSRRNLAGRAGAQARADVGWRTSRYSAAGPGVACVQVTYGIVQRDGSVHLDDPAGPAVVLGQVGHGAHSPLDPVAPKPPEGVSSGSASVPGSRSTPGERPLPESPALPEQVLPSDAEFTATASGPQGARSGNGWSMSSRMSAFLDEPRPTSGDESALTVPATLSTTQPLAGAARAEDAETPPPQAAPASGERRPDTTSRPSPSSGWLNDLTAMANLALRRHLQAGGELVGASRQVDRLTPQRVEELHEKLPKWIWKSPMQALADRIAQAHLNDGEPVLLLGSGYGFEFETTIALENTERLVSEEEDIYNLVLGVNRAGLTAKMDLGIFYLDPEGVHYWSLRDLEAAGKRLDRRINKPIIEFVSSVFPGPGDQLSRRYNRERAVEAIRELDRRLMQASDDGRHPVAMPLQELLLTEDGWTLVPRVADAEIRAVFHPASSIDGEMLLHPQVTAAVETTEISHWLHRTKQITRQTGADPDWIQEDGLAFGREIARDFVHHVTSVRVPEFALDLLDLVEDVAAIRNFIALTYTHISAFLAQVAGAEQRLTKNYLLFALRTSLRGARQTLTPAAQDFIENNADAIRKRLQKTFRNRYPRYEDSYLRNLRKTNPKASRRDIPAPLTVSLDIDGKNATVGDLLDNALLAAPQFVLGQDEVFGIYTNFREAETNSDGIGRVVGESRQVIQAGISGAAEYLSSLERWLEESHQRARNRHEFSVANGGWYAEKLLQSVRLLTDRSLLGTAFNAVRNSAADLVHFWQRVDGHPELLSKTDMATILVGLQSVGDQSEQAQLAVTRALDVVDGFRSRLDTLNGKETSITARIEIQDALWQAQALRDTLAASGQSPAPSEASIPGLTSAIRRPQAEARPDSYFAVLRHRLDPMVARHLAEEVNAAVREQYGAGAPYFNEQQVVVAFRELPGFAPNDGAPQIVGWVVEQLISGRPEAEYDPGPLPIYERSAGRHATELGAFERLYSSADYWRRLAETHEWWDQTNFEHLRGELKADAEELALFSLAIRRIPHEIPATAKMWGVTPTFLYGLSKSLNVDPQYLTGIKDHLRDRFADRTQFPNGVSEIYDAIKERLNGYVRELRELPGDHTDIQYAHLLMIAHFGIINISRDLEDFVRFVAYDGIDGKISMREMLYQLNPQEITMLASDWRRHEEDQARSTAPAPEPPAVTAKEPAARRSLPGRKRLSQVLPESEWWRLYLDPRHHQIARERYPDNPGSFYDNDQSPGYQQSMLNAYREILDSEDMGSTRLDYDAYKHLHDLVTEHAGEGFDWTGQEQDYKGINFVSPTNFPLGSAEPSPEIFAERVAGRPLLLRRQDVLNSPDPPVAFLTRLRYVTVITTAYRRDEVAGLVDAALERYYSESEQAASVDERLRAIARVVRNLHIIHPFTDGNGRLHIHLLLPKLLLEQGLRPVVFADMGSSFNGARSLDELVDILKRGQDADLTADIIIEPSGDDTSSDHDDGASGPAIGSDRGEVSADDADYMYPDVPLDAASALQGIVGPDSPAVLDFLANELAGDALMWHRYGISMPQVRVVGGGSLPDVVAAALSDRIDRQLEERQQDVPLDQRVTAREAGVSIISETGDSVPVDHAEIWVDPYSGSETGGQLGEESAGGQPGQWPSPPVRERRDHDSMPQRSERAPEELTSSESVPAVGTAPMSSPALTHALSRVVWVESSHSTPRPDGEKACVQVTVLEPAQPCT
jgi:Fic/DOC family